MNVLHPQLNIGISNMQNAFLLYMKNIPLSSKASDGNVSFEEYFLWNILMIKVFSFFG